MGDWDRVRIMVKAGTARTNLTHTHRNKPHDYNRAMLDFIRMCLNSGLPEAVEVGKECNTQHMKWQMENGLFR